jgi:hypothetical protein
MGVYSVFGFLAWQWELESEGIETNTLSKEEHYESSDRKHEKAAIHPVL